VARDCASFVCWVAAAVLGHTCAALVADARWLIDALPTITFPLPGDIVCYQRRVLLNEAPHRGLQRNHVMMYVGNGQVVGACDVAGRIIARPLDYESNLGPRQWHIIDPPSCRALI
jgi:hypothetical protein